jgi:3-oxoacyl-[acyl-carrier protein] reductase
MDPRIQTALVTGSAKRNGRAMALWLAERGVKVAVHYMGSKAEAEDTLAEAIKGAPGSVLVQGDLTDPQQAQHVVNTAAEELGSLHVLVNNVGNYLRKDLFDLTPDEWRDQLESNLYTSFWCTQAAVRVMKPQGFGRVVNIGYAGGERPTYNRLTVPYHIAKAGLGMLTRNAAAALARTGITVNTIGVGIMENSIVKPDDPPAGRFATYEDLCHALEFLLSAKSEHVTGTQLDVNGGWIPEQKL